MKKYILLISVLLLNACSMGSMNIENPFSSTTNVQNVYLSQFPDVPIPADMHPDAKNTITTISSNGEKIGKEVLKGRVEHNSLGAAMAHNLKNQGWNMIGIVQGKATLQLYNKASRYLIVVVEDGNFNSTLTLWMINQLGGQDSFMNNVQDIFMETPPSELYDNQYQEQNVTPLSEQSNTQNQQAFTQNGNQQSTLPQNAASQNTNTGVGVQTTDPNNTQQNLALKELEQRIYLEQQAQNAQQTSQSHNFDSFGDNSLFK